MSTVADINAEARSLCDADSTSYPADVLLRRVNQAYEEITGKLIQGDGRWQFDDSNYTDLPIGTTTLVADQQDYSFDVRFLNVERVEVLDVNGIWHEVTPIDKPEIDGAIAEYHKTSGLPVEYDKQGESIILYPAPSASFCTLTAGLKVHYQRTASIFTSAEVTTGTKTPGFASPWHMLLAYKAAIPYCMSYKKDRVALYEAQAMKMEKELLAFESRRNKDERVRIGIIRKQDFI